jgi:threonine aldolase
MKFGSDNQAGASDKVVAAVLAANSGYEHSYGTDSWTQRAVDELRKVFECDLDAYFVPTGTAANSLALSCLAQPWNTLLCHNDSHVLLDELTAPEFFTGGARLIGISRGEGKLLPRHVAEHLQKIGHEPPHNAPASVLSITQCSENGLVYTPQELTQLCGIAHAHGMKVHMDGARFANALATLDCAPADITWRAGVDVLCLGATKNGALGAEAVIFFDRSLAAQFAFRRKRAGHLLSKSRFMAAQFVAWLQDGHWLALARHANAHALRLAAALSTVTGIRIVWPVEANEVFAILRRTVAEHLRKAGAEFYDWPLSGLPPGTSLGGEEIFVRLVTSFATADAEIDRFCALAGERG